MGERRIEGIHYQTGESIEVCIRDGKIIEINHTQDKIENESSGKTMIAPGLVDLQINGYKGMDYNTLPILDGMVKEVTHEIFSEGVTTYYPTVITNSADSIEEAVRSITIECKRDELIGKAIAGIHIEGPFISAEDGPRGAHNKAFVQAPDWEMFSKWQKAAEGQVKIITLSPEWSRSAEFIEKCMKSGVKVSIGHTAATPEQIRRAVAAGAKLSTHLGNGAHLMLPRHPNYIWEQLAQEELWTCLIGDGFHLPESVLKVAMAAKGKQAMLVSDAVYLSGMQPGEYETHIGGKVVLTKEGKLHTADNPKILAGSAQMLLWGIQHLTNKSLASLATAWDMSSIRPAKFMNLPSQSGLTEGAPADIVCFTSGQLEVIETYKEGKLMYRK
jgi:N-acetylglucosamine-6-phosphate deacetylase